jgi:hypothetical protein
MPIQTAATASLARQSSPKPQTPAVNRLQPGWGIVTLTTVLVLAAVGLSAGIRSAA